MIRGFVPDNGRLRLVDDALEQLDKVLWIDLVSPTNEEERVLETRLGLDIPTREEMEEIEVSSRLYSDNGAAFMTATLPSRTDTDELLMGPVTFVLAADKLITVRYHEPRAFNTFPQRAEQVSLGCTHGDTILIALLEAVVDRLADVLERMRRDVDALSRTSSPTLPHKGRPRLQSRAPADRPKRRSRVERPGLARVAAAALGILRAADSEGERQRAARPHQDAEPRRSIADRPHFVSVAEDHVRARRHARDDQHRAEQHHQDFLDRGRRLSAPDVDRVDLRNELHSHAGAALAGRLPAGVCRDAAVRAVCPSGGSSGAVGSRARRRSVPLARPFGREASGLA